jgi:phage gp45-like
VVAFNSDKGEMEMRSTLAEAARRAYNTLTRATLKGAKDDKLMQEVDIDLWKGEARKTIERFQQYGISSVPHKAKDEKTDEVAEALIGYVNGNPAHAVIMAIDDRRHRLKNQKEGEVALYDDQGQILRITRDGIHITSHKAVTHSVAPPKKNRGEKDYGQDANMERETKTSITQSDKEIKIQVGEKTHVTLNEKGITLQTDKDITNTADGTIVANGDTQNWKGPKE